MSKKSMVAVIEDVLDETRHRGVSFEGKVERVLKALNLPIMSPTDARTVRIINKMARMMDEGFSWPYRPAAEGAIRKARQYFNANGNVSNYEYACMIYGYMSDIVNDH
jgi:hypothetical protein